VRAACLTFDERFALAFEHARMVFERRGGFISDDDLLDIADAWEWGGADRERLLDALFNAVFED
jgi:hypothetical protein